MSFDLWEDNHTHTDQTDGADSLDAMLNAAEAAGLARIVVTDHVRRDSHWVPDYVRAVRTQAALRPLEVVCGVEAKILDTFGRLDLPGGLDGVAQVIVADHQFPTRRGPMSPRETGELIASGAMRPEDAIADLIDATARAVHQFDRVVVGHLFSVLPKIGLDESVITREHVSTLAAACRAADAAVEINEKWRTPSERVAHLLSGYGVRLVASSDAHGVAAVGTWDYVRTVADGMRDPESSHHGSRQPEAVLLGGALS